MHRYNNICATNTKKKFNRVFKSIVKHQVDSVGFFSYNFFKKKFHNLLVEIKTKCKPEMKEEKKEKYQQIAFVKTIGKCQSY